MVIKIDFSSSILFFRKREIDFSQTNNPHNCPIYIAVMELRQGDFTLDGRRSVSEMLRRHCFFFLLLHMRKCFVYKNFPEMSISLKSRNHFNFSTPNKCRFLFKPIILEY